MIQTMLNYSVVVGIVILAVIGWVKSESKGWRRTSFVCLLIMFPFAMSFGEQWFISHKSLLWLFGIEQEFVNRTDWGPVFFLMILGLLIPRLLRWPINFAASWYSKSEKTPGSISPYAVVATFLALSLYLVAGAGAYLNKTKGYQVGTNVVASMSETASDIFAAGDDLSREIGNKKKQTRP
ncbi:MAG: hypothetical protein WC505_04045 [Patescibacteria group bacterium]